MSKTLAEQLAEHEGLRLKPYRDTVGKLTIGIGRNLDDKGISEAEAYYLLNNDIHDVNKQLIKHIPWYVNLPPNARRVLQDMCFNLGIYGLLGFKKFLSALQAGDIERAKVEMMDSKWAKQVGRRAVNLRNML